MTQLEKFAQTLNEPQRRAAFTTTGPVLVLAGAGSGKTRVLTFRTSLIIAEGLAQPHEVLAVTFTNKAAREMAERVHSLLSVPMHSLWISTFHSLCSRILRKHISEIGYDPQFVIYDSSDQLSVVRRVVGELGLDEKIYNPKALYSRINGLKNKGYTVDTADEFKRRLEPEFMQVFDAYEKRLKAANALDFNDLLIKTEELFAKSPDTLAFYADRFKYVMVDEYQDTNRTQYELVKKLSQKHRNLFVVGDEDQSIYGWRGADVQNILSFEKDYPDCEIIKLEQNYRSTRTIVESASKLIQNNNIRNAKVLFTENPEGEKILVREEASDFDEAKFVAGSITQAINEFSPNEIAVFYRTNAQSRLIEEQFRSRGIPYRVVGGIRFYERLEIKDVLAYLRFIMNPKDDVAFRRIINVPTRGIGKTTVDRLEEMGNRNGTSLIEACSTAVDTREFNAGTTSKLRGFLDLVQTMREAARTLSLLDFYHKLIDETKYIQRLKEEDSVEADSRIENLQELSNSISRFSEERGDEANLQTFLEEVALVTDTDENADPASLVTLMTLHVSKGLEFPLVYVVGCEEGLFPSLNSDEGMEDSELEEERRLAYVGMTRARKKLVMTYARSRRVWGSPQMNPPSRFLKEIPEKYVEWSGRVQKPNLFYQASSSNTGFSKSWRKTHDELAQDSHVNYEDMAEPHFDESSGFNKGMRVRHPTFGVGSIFQLEGTGDNAKISVLFGDNSIKKFVAKFARLEKA